MNAGIDGWKIISIQPYEAIVDKVDRLQQISVALTAVFFARGLAYFLRDFGAAVPAGRQAVHVYAAEYGSGRICGGN